MDTQLIVRHLRYALETPASIVQYYEGDSRLFQQAVARVPVPRGVQLLELDCAADSAAWLPLSPLLPLLQRFLQHADCTAADLCAAAGVSSLHWDMWVSALQNDRPRRREPPFLEEIPYERHVLRRELMWLLAAASEHTPLLLYIYNAHTLGAESLQLLLELMTAPLNSACAVFVQLLAEEPIGEEPFVREHMLEVHLFQPVLRLEDVSAGDGAAATPAYTVRRHVQRPFPEDCTACLDYLQCYSDFLDARAGVTFSSRILDARNHLMTREQRNTFACERARLHIYMKEYYQAKAELAEIETDPGSEMWARKQYLLAAIWYAGSEFAAAARAAAEILETAELEPALRSLVRFLQFQANVQQGRVSSEDSVRAMARELEDCGYTNLAINALLHGEQTGPPEAVPMHKEDLLAEASRRAEESGNSFALSTALHLKGLRYSQTHGEHSAIPYYRQALEMRAGIDDPLSLVRIHNGLAYALLNLTRYGEAAEHLMAAIGLLEQVTDFVEMAMTIFNLSNLCFHGRDYTLSHAVLTTTLRVINILDIQHLPYHNERNIAILRAFIAVKSGNVLQARSVLAGLAAGNERVNYHYRPLYELIGAMASAAEGDGAAVRDGIAVALQHIPTERNNRLNLFPLIHLEAGLLEQQLGSRDAALQLWESGHEFAVQNQLERYVQWFSELRSHAKVLTPYPFAKVSMSHGSIIALARQERLLRKMNRKLESIRFLHQSMELFERQGSIHAFAGRLIAYIAATYNSNAVALYRRGEESWEVLDYALPGEMNGGDSRSGSSDEAGSSADGSTAEVDEAATGTDAEPTAAGTEPPVAAAKTPAGAGIAAEPAGGFPNYRREVLDGLAANSSRIVIDAATAEVPAELSDWREYIAVPLMEDDRYLGLLLLGGSKLTAGLTHEDYEVLSILGQHAAAKLVNINHTRMLVEQALTDNLTGLPNRQGLQQHVDRIESNHPGQAVTLCFIDLDNFKYYNDTFGHRVGDSILKQFSNMLRGLFRGRDFVARYGGDEFLVVMQDADEKHAEQAFQRILTGLERHEYFAGELLRGLGELPEIPAQQRLGCSMGIASGEFTGPQLDELISRADQALYSAKEQGKGRAAVWQEQV